MQQTVSFKRGDVVRVMVERLAFEGPGVARVEAGVDSEGKPRRLVVFIEGVAPGDEVEVELFAVKRGLARGRVKRFVGRSPARVKPRCPHFGMKVDDAGEAIPYLSVETADGQVRHEPDLSANCGGCTWQFLSYEDQLKVKTELVKDALTRIGGISAEQLEAVWKPILASEQPWYYRNKMDFSFVRDRDGGLHLGLHMKGRYRDVTEINSCDLFRPWVGEFLREMRSFWAGQSFPGGELQSLTVRAGTNTGEVMVNLIVEKFESSEVIAKFTDVVVTFFKSPEFHGPDHLVSVFWTNIHNKKGQPKRFEEQFLWGEPVFREVLKVGSRELNFEVAPGAFLQPNTRQAERFYALVSELADLKGGERVFDLFCGTGTMGICLAAATNIAARREAPAASAGQVTGLELNAQAVENAQRNAELNGVKNIDFVVGDATKVLPEMGTAVDLIVVDPPRAGMTEKVIDTIASTAARRLIYVSCNPATLARDLKLLLARGFRLEFVQAIDQFSQTYHVETVTMLER